MSTEQPVREPHVGQIWSVHLGFGLEFIGELSWISDNAAAFVVHALVGCNLPQAEPFLGQVICVPRQVHLWGYLGGPR